MGLANRRICGRPCLTLFSSKLRVVTTRVVPVLDTLGSVGASTYGHLMTVFLVAQDSANSGGGGGKGRVV